MSSRKIAVVPSAACAASINLQLARAVEADAAGLHLRVCRLGTLPLYSRISRTTCPRRGEDEGADRRIAGRDLRHARAHRSIRRR